MDLREFQEQLDRCHQSDTEVRTFVRDVAFVRMKHIIRELLRLEEGAGTGVDHGPYALTGVTWEDAIRVAESGIDPTWIKDVADPDDVYLHIDAALKPTRGHIRRLLEMTFLSEKQRRVLFPCLSKVKRPSVSREELAIEVRCLNEMLRWAILSGMTWERYARYQQHIRIDGASRNLVGQVGAVGGVIAIIDALEEIAPGRIREVLGPLPPRSIRKPIEIYEHFFEGAAVGMPKAILLENGRAVVFAADPDIAIFQSLGAPYSTARQAVAAWEDVRRDISGRGQKVHQFAVGEIKTATDPQNLHERLALGSRETREEIRTDRFLMMSILTKEVLTGSDNRRRRQPAALANRDVERFSDVFNLYFAWGYDEARRNHPEHWAAFKQRISAWCDL